MTNITLAQDFDVSYPVAIAAAIGKTSTERKLAVIESAPRQALNYLVDLRGKVGNAVRATIKQDSIFSVALAARRGNYKPLAHILAAKLGKTVSIASRAEFAGLQARYRDALMDMESLKNRGYRTNKKTGAETPTSARVALTECAYLITQVESMIADIVAQESTEQMRRESVIE